jgi:uncharacterized membrane protein
MAYLQAAFGITIIIIIIFIIIGPSLLPKRVLQKARSTASCFSFQYPLV